MRPVKQMRAALAAAPVLNFEQVRQVPGYAYGLRAAAVLARVEVAGAAHWREVARRGLALLSAHLRVPRRAEVLTAPIGTPSVPSGIALAVATLQDAAGMPFVGEARVIPLPARVRAADSQLCLLAVPAFAPAAAAQALQWIGGFFRQLAAAPDQDSLTAPQRAELERLLAGMARLAPRGANNRFFINAAHELDIPFMPLPGGVIQYGWGRRSRWLDSSFTESTSTISSRIARNKVMTHALLRQAGLPVAAQRLVATPEAALEGAAAFGYPVVVKPANQDGGVGVSAGLHSEDEVRAAFDRARRYSADILVEKHVDGRDYRVYVFRGRAVGAMLRTPGGVTGDGVQTLEWLVAEANRDPRRGEADWSPLAPLVLDDEALGLLAAAGMNPQSIPARGEFVRLRRSANVSTGGIPTEVFRQVHPDNARLCERAAHALRLDLAGIDLLIPDISRSWRESGAAICEVNGQPQISSVATAHLFARLLGEMVPARGRIPCILVLSSGSCTTQVRAIADLLAQQGMCVGTTCEEGLRIGAQWARRGRPSAFADARGLLLDACVDAVVIGADGKEWLAAGLPVDRVDVLVVADVAGDVRGVLALIEPHCKGEVLVSRQDPARAAVGSVLRGQRLRLVDSNSELAAAAASSSSLLDSRD